MCEEFLGRNCDFEYKMDKSWMHIKDRAQPEYSEGVKQVLDFAFAHETLEGRIYCPCKNCNNCELKTRDDVEADLHIFGIAPTYTRWVNHGENIHELSDDALDSDDESDEEEMHEVMQDHFGALNTERWIAGDLSGDSLEEPNEEAEKFYRLLRDHEKKLYTANGRAVNEASQQKLDLMQTLSTQVSEGTLQRTEDEIFVDVFDAERHGRVRGYGAGIIPTDLCRASSSNMHDLEKRLEESERRHEEALRRLQESEQKREADAQAFNNQINALRNDFQSFIANLTRHQDAAM